MANHSPIEYPDYQNLLGKSNSVSDRLQRDDDSKLEDISEQENKDENE